MVESFKRYYHNSFLDAQRQEAYNLFLGNYIFTQGQPMLWDLQTDYYLHHLHPRFWPGKAKRDYMDWYTPKFLELRTLPPIRILGAVQQPWISTYDDFWLEYYRPLSISSFSKTFSWKLSNKPSYLSGHSSYHHGPWDPSPFVPRKPPHTVLEGLDSPGKRPRKGVTILDPRSDEQGLGINVPPANGEPQHAKQSILRGTGNDAPPSSAQSGPTALKDTNAATQWTLNQFYHNSLNPSVALAEMEEYVRYISHPLNLPLVVSTDEPDENDAAHLDYAEYIGSAGEGAVEQFGLSNGGDLTDEEFADYVDFVTVAENPLTVGEEDGEKKRYKAYRQWLRGKSLFKQSKVDPEFKSLI